MIHHLIGLRIPHAHCQAIDELPEARCKNWDPSMDTSHASPCVTRLLDVRKHVQDGSLYRTTHSAFHRSSSFLANVTLEWTGHELPCFFASILGGLTLCFSTSRTSCQTLHKLMKITVHRPVIASVSRGLPKRMWTNKLLLSPPFASRCLHEALVRTGSSH